MNRSSIGFILFCLIGALSFPLVQLTQGPVYYVNGLDETSYLQYDYARIVAELAGMARASEWLVVWLHDFGFSGGWINFFADAFFVPLTLGVALHAFWMLEPDERDESQPRSRRWSPLEQLVLVTGLPLVVGAFNPLVKDLAQASIDTQSAYWITYPHSTSLALFRTPEPQLSYAVLAVALWMAARWRTPLPFLVIIPFLYPFIALPIAFIALGAFFAFVAGARPIVSVFGALFVTGAAYFVYLRAFVPEEVLGYFVQTRLPLLSWCGLVSIGAAFVCRTTVRGPRGLINILLLISPWVAVNLQIPGGWLLQPNNYEQYFSVLIPPILLVLNPPQSSAVRRGAVLIAIVALASSFVFDYERNRVVTSRLPMKAALAESIQKFPERIAIDSVEVSSWFNLLYPRQHATLFSITRTYKRLGGDTFHDYLCAKRGNQVTQGYRLFLSTCFPDHGCRVS